MYLARTQRTGRLSARWFMVAALFVILAFSACAPTTTTTFATDTCNGEQGCCCNSPVYYNSSAGTDN